MSIRRLLCPSAIGPAFHIAFVPDSDTSDMVDFVKVKTQFPMVRISLRDLDQLTAAHVLAQSNSIVRSECSDVQL
jgi:hypothetical protein